jgi:cytidylate kinase
MIISICGSLGAGKSTLAKLLSEKLGWPRYYIGGLRRKRAEELGLTLAEYNKMGENDPKTDFEVDEYQKELGEKEDNFIIEGRTSWYFIPQSVKIFIEVCEEEGARRIFGDLKNDQNERNEDCNIKNYDEVLASMKKRITSDILRYKKYYAIDVYDKKHFDFVLNTDDLSIKEAFDKLYGFVRPLVDKK